MFLLHFDLIDRKELAPLEVWGTKTIQALSQPEILIFS